MTGSPPEPSSPPAPPEESFWDEVRSLLGGLGWGIRWFLLSAGWALACFALIMLVGRTLLDGQPERPLPTFLLIGILALITFILWRLRRRFPTDPPQP